MRSNSSHKGPKSRQERVVSGPKRTGCLFQGSVLWRPLFNDHFKVGLTSIKHRNRHRVLFEALAMFSCHDSCSSP